MKPAPFDYHRATSVADAVEALAGAAADGEGEGKIIAGGQSLVPLLALRVAQPTVLVDLNGLDGLRTPTPTVDRSSGQPVAGFGAMTTHADLIDQRAHPLVAEAATWIGHTAIRTRGTLGGSLAHADPNAELPAVALACDAALSVAGPAGHRTVAIGDWFEGILQTALADDEVLIEVDLRVPTRWGFAELARRAGDFALVLAAVTELDDGWRVAIGGVGGVPVRCTEAEAALAAAAPIPEVAEAAVAALEPYDDLHASARYRRAMAAEMVSRAVAAARDARPGGEGEVDR